MTSNILPQTQFKISRVTEIYNDNLTEIVVNRKTITQANIEPCIKYIQDYFYKTQSGYIYFDVDKNEFYQLCLKDVNNAYFNMFPKEVKEWLTHQNPQITNIICDAHKPRLIIYDAIKEKVDINLSGQFKFTVQKNYDEYPQEVKDKVNKWLSFIYVVIANEKKEMYDYLLKWMANVMKGIRNSSLIYLKSVEGTGKSTFCELLHGLVGDKLGVKLDAEQLTTSYNKLMMGKIFGYFEELPCFTDGQWSAVSSKIKNYVTSDTIQYTDKYEKTIICENHINLIINTNVNALKDSSGRRILIADISLKHLQDHKYFETLKRECKNDVIHEALYWYLRSIDTTDFNGQSMPETESKLNAKINSMPSPFIYLKNEYILKNQGIDYVKTKDLYDDYCLFTDRNKLNKYKVTDFYSKLKEIQLVAVYHDRTNRYKATFDELNDIAKKNGWIHEYDEYSTELNINIPNTKTSNNVLDMTEFLDKNNDNDNEFTYNLMNENEKLKKQIEELKKELEKYKPQPEMTLIQKKMIKELDLTDDVDDADDDKSESDDDLIDKKYINKKKVIPAKKISKK